MEVPASANQHVHRYELAYSPSMLTEVHFLFHSLSGNNANTLPMLNQLLVRLQGLMGSGFSDLKSDYGLKHHILTEGPLLFARAQLVFAAMGIRPDLFSMGHLSPMVPKPAKLEALWR